MKFSSLHGDDTGPENVKGRLNSRRRSVQISEKKIWGMPIPSSPAVAFCGLPRDRDESFDNVDPGCDSETSRGIGIGYPWNTVENLAAVGLTFSNEERPLKESPSLRRFLLDETDPLPANVPKPLRHYRFDKWMKTLQRKTVHTRQIVSRDLALGASEPDFLNPKGKEQALSGHKKSLSGSSFDFVTAVKSASISLASFSVAPLSRRTGLSSRQLRTDHSSRASNAGVRRSEDSASMSKRAVIDEAVYHRSVQRRQVIEEIISTEESYIADIRFLQNVYVTLLASIPTISQSLRTSINQNLNDIVELHEELLGNLHRVVPHSEYSQIICARLPTVAVERGHRRFRSLEVGPGAPLDLSALQKVPGMSAEASVAAGVAIVFGQKVKMHRFFVYEEYGAKYESMVRDISSTHRTMPQWDMYQKGLEALAASLSSINNQNEHLNKSLTVGDLLVKPIQRVCRYPLMFAELLKQTPVCDCPDSHMEIENVLIRLRETTSEINRATNDPRMKATMEKTWILQDRLVLTDHTGARSKTALRTLGHIHLCGVLHVAWQTQHSVDGQYMISLLYKDYLVLANAGKPDHIYVIRAVIGLGEVRLEEADNGRGLQCHTAPFSWKLVFEYDHQLYEMIFSASSPKEELEWRSRLVERACKEQIATFDPTFFNTLPLDMKSLGVVFGKPGTVARRISIHRATTIGPKSSLYQVIIKNTSTLKEVPYSSLSTTINRSQSLLSTNRISVLAPSRSDRVCLENLLSDVWTRDILPFPGMTGRARNEQSVRASASSMMRKLSVASITSNFNKRSASMVSLSSTHRVADEKREPVSTKHPYHQGFESIVPDAVSAAGSDDTSSSRLSIIQDENSPFNERAPPMTDMIHACTPTGTLKRLATLRGKKSWEPEVVRVITPPLRASSANSLSNNRTPLSTESPHEGNENQLQMKYNIWTKAAGINKITYTEGIRNFFR